jgi:hypothetical protein
MRLDDELQRVCVCVCVCCCGQVPSLLHDIHIEMRTLGAELLAVFTKVQTPVDNKLEAIQSHIPLVSGPAGQSQSFGPAATVELFIVAHDCRSHHGRS